MESFYKKDEKTLRPQPFNWGDRAGRDKRRDGSVFFSHDHPGELFPKVLEWKDKISQTYYVVTQEIYEKNKTKLEEAKITDRVKVAKPNHAFKIKNCVQSISK